MCYAGEKLSSLFVVGAGAGAIPFIAYGPGGLSTSWLVLPLLREFRVLWRNTGNEKTSVLFVAHDDTWTHGGTGRGKCRRQSPSPLLNPFQPLWVMHSAVFFTCTDRLACRSAQRFLSFQTAQSKFCGSSHLVGTRLRLG